MQKIFLHIGTHKTATTWLQHYFAKNSDRLNDFGFYYPMSGRVTQAQHRLGQAIFQRKSSDRPLDSVPVWEKFKRELDLTRYENILVSSEEFEWVQHPKVIKNFLPNTELHVIVYLRRQDDYLESFYGQQVRDYHPRLAQTIDQYIDGSRLGFLDYDALLRRWEAAADSITVRVFDKARMVGGDVGEDFLAALGLPTAEGFEAPTASVIEQKSNLRMEALEFVRQCNRLKMTAVMHEQLVSQVIRLNRAMATMAPPAKERLLTFDMRQRLMARYASGNRNLTARFFPQHRTESIFADVADDAALFRQSNADSLFETVLKVNSLVRVS